MNRILSLAVLLLLIWVILRVALAITSLFLNIIWVIAAILAIFWVVGKFRGKG